MPTAEVEVPEAFGFLFEPELGAVRYRVAHGGRGSAKSWQFARALLVHASARPLRVLCGREYQNSVKESVHHLLVDQIDRMGLDGVFDVQETVIRGRNGSEFIFKGLRRDPRSLKSLEAVDICWIEEAEAVSKTSWEILIPTIRKPGSEIWVSFNPALESDPTYQRFVADPPENAIVKTVSWSDNPWLSDELRAEKDDLLRRDPEAFAHVWGGEPWRRSDAEVFAGKWVVQDFTPGEGWQGPYFGADWGFARDPTLLTKWWIADSRLYLEYEAGGVQLDMDQTATAFRTVPGAERYVIRADSARPETINEMKRRRFRVEAAPKWSGSVEDGIAHFRTYDLIVIHPRCKRAIEEARLYRYKVDPRTDEVLPQIVDKHNHVWDSGRYALAPLIRQRTGFQQVPVVYAT